MHGGLFSRDDVTLDDIRKIDRNREPPEDGKNNLSFLSPQIHIVFQFVHHLLSLSLSLNCWSYYQLLIYFF